MTTMKAVRIHAYGDPDQLVYEDAPVPAIGAGEVLVEVHAIGVNPVDYKTRQGSGVAGRLGENPFPIIVGWDISGVVTEVSPDVTTFKVGDEVYGMVNFPDLGNAYAEYVVSPAAHLAKKPASLSHTEAAALPLAALTAWQALFDNVKLQAGETILIHAAAGGVGHLAVQLAKWRGATVIGTASAGNAGLARELGADNVIDYTAVAFEDAVEKVDVVLDTVGGDTLERSYRVVNTGGRLATIVGQADAALAEQVGITAARTFVHTSGDELQKIAEVVEAGHLRPLVGHLFPLAEAAQAHELSEGRHARGKIVLEVK